MNSTHIPLILVLISTSASGQSRGGSLRGLITDELGAAIVGASVTLTDAQRSQKKTMIPR